MYNGIIVYFPFVEVRIVVEYCFSLSGLVSQSDVCPIGNQKVAGFDIPVRHNSFVEIDLEIFSTFFLSLALIQEGDLSVTEERLCPHTRCMSVPA